MSENAPAVFCIFVPVTDFEKAIFTGTDMQK